MTNFNNLRRYTNKNIHLNSQVVQKITYVAILIVMICTVKGKEEYHIKEGIKKDMNYKKFFFIITGLTGLQLKYYLEKETS